MREDLLLLSALRSYNSLKGLFLAPSKTTRDLDLTDLHSLRNGLAYISAIAVRQQWGSYKMARRCPRIDVSTKDNKAASQRHPNPSSLVVFRCCVNSLQSDPGLVERLLARLSSSTTRTPCLSPLPLTPRFSTKPLLSWPFYFCVYQPRRHTHSHTQRIIQPWVIPIIHLKTKDVSL